MWSRSAWRAFVRAFDVARTGLGSPAIMNGAATTSATHLRDEKRHRHTDQQETHSGPYVPGRKQRNDHASINESDRYPHQHHERKTCATQRPFQLGCLLCAGLGPVANCSYLLQRPSACEASPLMPERLLNPT